jgi:hypothetical protein
MRWAEAISLERAFLLPQHLNVECSSAKSAAPTTGCRPASARSSKPGALATRSLACRASTRTSLRPCASSCKKPSRPAGKTPCARAAFAPDSPVELLDRLLEPPQHEALLADRHPLPFDHEVSLSPLSVGLVPDSFPSWTSPFAALAPSTAPQRGLGELGIGRLRPMAHPSLRGADAVEATPHQSRDNPASVQRVSRATSPECRRGSAPEAWYRLVMPEPDGQTTDK